MRKRRNFTKREDKVLIQRYADTSGAELAQELRRSVACIYARAAKLGIKKSKEFMRELGKMHANHPDAVKHRFKKGHPAFNKGKRQADFMSAEGLERTKATRFKPGRIPHNAKPVGYERIDKEGYVLVKMPGEKKMVHKHRYVYEQHNGPVPEGYKITFVNGDRTDCDISNLKLISFAELTRINTRNMTQEKHRERIEKAKETRNKTIQRDRRRIQLGLRPLTSLVVHGTKEDAEAAVRRRSREYNRRKRGAASEPKKKLIIVPDWSDGMNPNLNF